jgi:hypothetical protein
MGVNNCAYIGNLEEIKNHYSEKSVLLEMVVISTPASYIFSVGLFQYGSVFRAEGSDSNPSLCYIFPL